MDFRGAWRKPGFKQFVTRIALFCAIFILISLIIGGVIVPGPLLYGLKFWYYGGLGYILLAMAIFFIVYARERLLAVKPAPRGHVWLYPVTALLVAAFYVAGWHVKRNPGLAAADPLLWGVLLHAIFLLIFVTLGFAVFNIRFVRDFTRGFRKELLVCLAIGVGFYAAMKVVWMSWEILSLGVSRLVYWLLLVAPGGATLVPPQTIIVKGFAVYIGEACSGVFSIFLFTSLYLLMIALDWKKLNKAKAVGLFVPTVVGLFLVNVLRVYLIVLVGAFYDPEFAVNLFHSYVGMVLFIAFFLGWQWLTYDWMKS